VKFPLLTTHNRPICGAHGSAGKQPKSGKMPPRKPSSTYGSSSTCCRNAKSTSRTRWRSRIRSPGTTSQPTRPVRYSTPAPRLVQRAQGRSLSFAIARGDGSTRSLLRGVDLADAPERGQWPKTHLSAKSSTSTPSSKQTARSQCSSSRSTRSSPQTSTKKPWSR